MSKQERNNWVAPKKRALFLRELAKSNLNVTKAAHAAGLRSTGGLYLDRKANSAFAERWQQIEDELLDELEAHHYRDALERPEDRRWVLSRRRRGRWGDRQQVAVEGDIEHVHSVREIPMAQLEELIRKRLNVR